MNLRFSSLSQVLTWKVFFVNAACLLVFFLLTEFFSLCLCSFLKIPQTPLSLYEYNTQRSYQLRKGFCGPYDGNVIAATNLYGFRDYAENVNKAGRYTGTNVLFAGDSVTFGYGICQDNTIPSILERWYGEKKKVVEFINAGVPAYGLEQSSSMITHLLRYRPSVVFHNFCLNDIFEICRKDRLEKLHFDSGQVLSFPASYNNRLFQDLFPFSYFARLLDQRIFASPQTPFGMDSFLLKRYEIESSFLVANVENGVIQERLEEMLSSYQSLSEQCKEKGSTYCVLYLPWQFELSNPSVHDYFVRELKKREIPVLDFHSLFLQNQKQKLFIDFDHLDYTGSCLVSSVIKQWLERNMEISFGETPGFESYPRIQIIDFQTTPQCVFVDSICSFFFHYLIQEKMENFDFSILVKSLVEGEEKTIAVFHVPHEDPVMTGDFFEYTNSFTLPKVRFPAEIDIQIQFRKGPGKIDLPESSPCLSLHKFYVAPDQEEQRLVFAEKYGIKKIELIQRDTLRKISLSYKKYDPNAYYFPYLHLQPKTKILSDFYQTHRPLSFLWEGTYPYGYLNLNHMLLKEPEVETVKSNGLTVKRESYDLRYVLEGDYTLNIGFWTGYSTSFRNVGYRRLQPLQGKNSFLSFPIKIPIFTKGRIIVDLLESKKTML